MDNEIIENEEDVTEATGASSSGRLIDLSVFFSVLSIVYEAEGGLDQEGKRLGIRYLEELLVNTDKYIAPALARSGLRALRRGPRGWTKLSNQALRTEPYQAMRGDLILRTLARMGKFPDTMKDVFGTGVTLYAAKTLAKVEKEESAQDKLRVIAKVRLTGGMTRTRIYTKNVIARLGVDISDFEESVIDLSAAKDLGQQLRVNEVAIANAEDPVDESDLHFASAEILSELDTLSQSSPSPDAVKQVAAVAAAEAESGYATDAGKRGSLSHDQEQAMMVRGRAIIAAGAGSGKTKTIASKIDYHVNDLGISPSQIIATSFSKKSADELVDRVKRSTGKGDALFSEPGSSDGFGTTHSISKKMCHKHLPNGQNLKVLDNETTLLKKAMAQVLLRADRPVQRPEVKGFFDVPIPTQRTIDQVESDPANQATPEPANEQVGNTWPQAVRQAHEFWDNTNNTQSATGRFIDQSYRKSVVGFLDMILKYRKEYDRLTGGQKNWLTNSRTGILPNAGVEFDPNANGVSGSSVDAGVVISGTGWYTNPANQWFNLGMPKNAWSDKKNFPRPVGPGALNLFISNMKGSLITPEQAAAQRGWDDMLTAGYGAYEWLKSHDTDYANTLTFGDMLVKASGALISNESVLEQYRRQYKVVLVDEAQDLNPAQHLFFGLLAGYIDPKTQKPYVDDDGVPTGETTADTFAFVGDDKQCLERRSLISTPDGKVPLESLRSGDKVLSYRNGKVVGQTVRHVMPSKWDCGYKVTTEMGQSVIMSPVHKLWATNPRRISQDDVFVYLMYRDDLGFRVGITNKDGVDRGEGYLSGFGGRCFCESASKMWILDRCSDREEALFKEESYSLAYGIPTYVFNALNRGLNQERANRIFSVFGDNGLKVLEDRNMSFDYPHWMSQGYTKHGRGRRIISLVCHSKTGTNVSFEWSDDAMDAVVKGSEISPSVNGKLYTTTPNGHRRLRRYFKNYREAKKFAEDVATSVGGVISHRMDVCGKKLRCMNASSLIIGMSLPVMAEDGSIKLDEIISIEEVNGDFLDVDVNDASNLFANDVLVSNSIYSFRGARPEEFISLSTEKGFETKTLVTNYRSGGVIVEAANKLVAHNKKQIPMVCEPMDRKKNAGHIEYMTVQDNRAGASKTAELIKDLTVGDAYSYEDFGVACRTNAEIYDFLAEMLKRQIPFRVPPKKFNVFNNKFSKAILSWVEFIAADASDKNKVNPLITSLHRAPQFFLKETFNRRLAELARGENYLDFLNNGGWNMIYDQSFRNRNVKSYLDALNFARSLRDRSPSDIVQEVLHGIKGKAMQDGEWVEISMVEDAIYAARRDPEVISQIAEESGSGQSVADMLDSVSDEQIRDLALAPAGPIIGLFDGYEDLDSALNYVAELKDANRKAEKSATDKDERKADAVQVDTIHGWKGLETKHIFVPMAKGTFPHKLSEGNADEMEAERRLAYVAITRGEERVTVIAPEVNMAGKEAGPSQFVFEACIPPEGSTEGDNGSEESKRPLLGSVTFSQSDFGADLAPLYQSWDADRNTWSPDNHLRATKDAEEVADVVLEVTKKD